MGFALARYLRYCRYFDEWITVTTAALAVFRERGDRHAEGGALTP
ncbi:hypothetical protein [Streptomyces sp. Cmuel-A718b]|nr:hypothetical protein [Streptomyces sp. Cmuel-A718b]SCF74301.1 hypothetical protein GA0115280_109750 [Streptomyces sp. Cmuel-A718b]